jgi:methylmalonyl-CoA mutase N-terminal domain/subunit
VARGTYIYPPKASLRLVTDLFAYCHERVPKWNTISISGYHIREAGSTAPQELAFTFANALEYVRAAKEKGLDPNAFGERLSFFFACHSDFIEEVAKFRAARRLWATLMKERFGVTNPKAQHLRFHVQTGGVTLTAQQPENNVVRVTVQALAAVLGGCQSLHTNSMDEALALPTQRAATTALRTQQVIAHESGVADMVDPLGGSFAVEASTDDIETEARRLLDGIESRGGALKAIERGEIQREIEESAYHFQRKMEVKDTIIVGVNQFVEENEAPRTDLLRVDPDLERDQVERLKKLRARRDASAWKASMSALEGAARTGTNVMPAMIDAVLAWATVGEIATCLRGVFGEHRDLA